VVAGLRKFLSPPELLGRKVCLVRNLKPAKLAGQMSEAMILAGETSDSNGTLTVKVCQYIQMYL
jgi:tRNA-binding EMAP/Myf-like protein